jgi:hypothetical protein
MNEGKATLAGGIVKTIEDLLITTLPIPLVLRMSMAKRQKYSVTILLGLGYLVTAAGALRTYYTYKAFFTTHDSTWYQYPAFLASAIEIDLAVVRMLSFLFIISLPILSPSLTGADKYANMQICACIPTLRPLWPLVFGGPIDLLSRFRSWTFSSRSSSKAVSTDRSTSNAFELGPKSSKCDPTILTSELEKAASFDPSPTDSDSDIKLVIQRHESFTLNEPKSNEQTAEWFPFWSQTFAPPLSRASGSSEGEDHYRTVVPMHNSFHAIQAL